MPWWTKVRSRRSGATREHAERGVPGVHELAGDRHDALQDAVEAEVRRHRDHGVQQQPLSFLATDLVSLLAHARAG